MSSNHFAASAYEHPRVTTILDSPFDLNARAELAIEGCTRLADSARNGQPYTYVELHTDPPVAIHAPWDYGDVSGRLLDALTLARAMTGQAPDEHDEALAKMLSSCQREDGLLSIPADPWTHTSPVVEMEWSHRGALMAWTTRGLALDDNDSRERAQRLVHTLYRRAVWEGDTCWFPASYLPEKGWISPLPPIDRMTDVLIGGQIIYPLVRFAEATGNTESLKLANGLIRFIRERSGAFDLDGKFTAKTGRLLHSNTGFILGVLKYGLMMDRPEYVEWSEFAYKHVQGLGTEFGFFPHGMTGKERWQGDVCAMLDMLEIAIMLGLHKNTAYLADAERYGRNHLLETQILHFDWVENGAEADFCQEMWCANHPEEGVDTVDICRKALGTFSGWNRLNDAFDPSNPRLSQRCTAAGTRALYDLWRYSVTRPEGAVMVNLHFSCDTRWATVTSHLPHRGCIEILMKTKGVLAVRVPPGIVDPEVLVNQNRPRNETMRNGYAWLEALQPGDQVTVSWPVEDHILLYELGDAHYTGHWRGDTLMRLSPVGNLSPLYRRNSGLSAVIPRSFHGAVKIIDSI